VGIIKNLLNSNAGLLKFLIITLSARWNGRSTKGSIGNEKTQKMFIAEKTKIRDNDILSVLVNIYLLFNPFGVVYCCLYPRLHRGLFIFNPFGVIISY
jgi:hypothetical protein